MRESASGPYTTEDTERLISNDSSNKTSSLKSSPYALHLAAHLRRSWTLLEDINRTICNERTSFILKHKPIFDEQKLILIEIQNYLEILLESGTVARLRDRREYSGRYLNTTTFLSDWNKLAENINTTLSDISSDIFVENTLAVLGSSRSHLRGDSSSTGSRPVHARFSWVVILCAFIGAFLCVSTLVGIFIMVLEKDHGIQSEETKPMPQGTAEIKEIGVKRTNNSHSSPTKIYLSEKLGGQFVPSIQLSPSFQLSTLTSTAVYSLATYRNKVFAGSSNGVIRVWDVNAKDIIATLRGHLVGVRALTVYRDTLVSSSYDKNGGGKILIFSAETHDLLEKYQSWGKGSVSLSVLPPLKWNTCMWNNPNTFVSQSNFATIAFGRLGSDRAFDGTGTYTSYIGSKTVNYLDLGEATAFETYSPHDSMITSTPHMKFGLNMTYYRDYSTSLFYADRFNYKIRVGNVSCISYSQELCLSVGGVGLGSWLGSGLMLRRMGKNVDMSGHSDWIRAMVVYKNVLFSASQDNTIRAWNVQSYKHIHTLRGHADGVTSLILYRNYLISGSLDNTVHVWNADTFEHITSINTGRQILSLTVSKSILYAAGQPKGAEKSQIVTGYAIISS